MFTTFFFASHLLHFSEKEKKIADLTCCKNIVTLARMDFSDGARASRMAALHEVFAAEWSPSFWRPHTWGFDFYTIHRFHVVAASLFRKVAATGSVFEPLNDAVARCMIHGAYCVDDISDTA